MQAVVTDNTVTINATGLTNANLSGSAAYQMQTWQILQLL